MNIWIISHGVRLVFKSFLDMPIKKDLVSGLLTALNEFVRSEFKQPIDYIKMGGLIWVYFFVEKHNLLFVAADKPDNTNFSTLKSRLDYIKYEFLKQYEQDEEWKNWNGNVELFKKFEDNLEKVYENWKAAENLDFYADLFDIIRIYQHLLNQIQEVIKNQIDINKKERLLQEINKYVKNFKDRLDIRKLPEFQKITYSEGEGFNIFTINPMNCDILIGKKELNEFLNSIVKIIKKVLGKDLSMNYFNEYNIYNYVLQNLDLLSRIQISDFILQLFLTPE